MSKAALGGKYAAYPEYKDSGVEWLGDIPKTWKVTKYKNVIQIAQGAAFKSSDYVDYSDVISIRMGNIKKGGQIDLNHNVKFLPNRHKVDFSNYQLVDGDLIIAMTDMSPSLDFLAVPAIIENLEKNKTYLLNQRVGKIQTFGINSDFLKYLLLSSELRNQLKALGLGTVQANMSNDDLYNAYFSSPTFVEQTHIAAFLDYETAKIDTLIEKQQQLIELLKEKRQAVISHAVTKGLNPQAPMKDSGVEWLGEVPEHWDLTPLKYLCNFKGGGTPTKDNLNYWKNGTIPWVSPKDMKSFWINKTLDYVTELAVKESSTNIIFEGSLMMVVRSGILQRTIPIAINTVPVTMNQDMKALLFNNKMLTEYAAYFIIGNIPQLLLEWSKEGATVESIEHEYLANSYFPVPPKEEQEKIICTIKSQLELFDNLETQAQQAIKLMQERRTALISAAVTGKIDVRDWVAPTTSNDTNEAQQEVTA